MSNVHPRSVPIAEADITDFLSDISYAFRSIRQNPGFAALVLGTLAVGIGANTAIFSVVNGVLLRPLPYEEPDRLAMVFRTVPRFGFDRSTSSYPDYADWKEGARSFSSLAAYGYGTVTYLPPEGAERWEGYRVTANLFNTLGVSPALGRSFTEEDDRPGAARTILLSHGTWQSRFGGNPDLLERTIRLDGEPVRVVGVLPPDFAFPSSTTEFWIPLRADPSRMERDTNFLTVIGRLRPGITVSAAQREMETLAGRIDGEAPGANKGYGVFVEARHAFEVRNARTALWVFLGAVTLVLIVACANVANLLLSRGTARRREIAVRTALGAGRGRLIRQFLTESLVFALVAAGLAVGLAVLLLKALVALGPSALPRLERVGLDPAVLGYTALLALGAGIAFGLAPALLGARSDLGQSLKEGAQAVGAGRLTRRLQRSFVVAQVALAISLSIGAALLLNSFSRLTSVQPGFDPSHVVAARLGLTLPEIQPPPGADEMSRDEIMAIIGPQLEARATRRTAFFEEVQRRTAQIPGVERVGLAYGLPFGRGGFSRVLVPEGLEVAEGEEPTVRGNVIAGDYLRAMAIRLVRGRDFTETDAAEAPGVALVNETMAGLFWPDQSPIGKRVRIGDGGGTPVTVVGVVADVWQRSLDEEQEPMYYRPFAQAGWPEAMFVAVRASTPTAELVPQLRRQVWSVDPEVPLTDIATAGELVGRTVEAPRFRTAVLATFGAVAALMALVGIYGVLAFAVGERTREIGVRMALGARRGDIVGMVLGSGMRLAIVGVVLGVAGALALTRFLTSMLFGLTPTDFPTFAATSAVVLGTAALACYLPARRAARVDPLKSLRYE